MDILWLCLKIFLVRIVDVSLGTFRTVTLVKGKTSTASFIGFFEVLIWFLVVKEALNTDVNSIWVAISYAGGFATGTLLGGYISDAFITGTVSVQVITDKISEKMINAIRDAGYAVSIMDLVTKNKKSPKNMLFIEIDKKEVRNLEKIIKQFDKKAFIVVNESKHVINGYFKGQVAK